MSAVTSIILVGSSHPSDGGIRPVSTIHLEEGSRPALVVQSRVSSRRDGSIPRLLTVIPTVSHMIDDSIVLAAYVHGYLPIVQEVNRITGGLQSKSNYLSMHDDFTLAEREALYEILKGVTDLPKITWCLFENSGFKTSLVHLKEYSFECEVTCSAYVKKYSVWTKDWAITGDFDDVSTNEM